MSDQKTQVSPLQSIQDKMEDNLRSEFVNLVPEEVWKGIVAQQMNVIVQKELPEIAADLIRAKLKEVMLEYLNTDQMTTTFNDFGQQACSDLTTKIASEHGMEIIMNMFSPLIYNITQNIRDGLLNMGKY